MKHALKAICAAALFATATVTVMATGAHAAGDAAKGESQFKICSACHTNVAGKNKIGPSLFGVIGRKPGSAEGFKYSPAYHEAAENGLVWSEEEIVKYLESPKDYLSAYLGKDRVKSRMLNKFPNKDMRQNVAAYLATLK